MRKVVQRRSASDATGGARETASSDASGAEQRLADLCRALAHPARVRILHVLIEKDVCIAGDLAEEVPLAPSTVSQHLKILREAGLIRGEVDGPRRCYCADQRAVALLKKLVNDL